MPNWITNYLEVTGNAERVLKFTNTVYSENGDSDNPYTFDFNAIIPRPKELEAISSPFQGTKEEAKELRKKYGATNWYDWSLKNWGCKWNASDCAEVEEIKEGCRFCFNTPWASPYPWIETAAKKFPDLKFIDTWHDEGGGQARLTVWHENGQLQYTDEEMSEHDWLYEFEPSYAEEFDFLTSGDYEEIIQTYKDNAGFDYFSFEKILAMRIKEKDLPLFAEREWDNSEAEEIYKMKCLPVKDLPLYISDKGLCEEARDILIKRLKGE